MNRTTVAKREPVGPRMGVSKDGENGGEQHDRIRARGRSNGAWRWAFEIKTVNAKPRSPEWGELAQHLLSDGPDAAESAPRRGPRVDVQTRKRARPKKPGRMIGLFLRGPSRDWPMADREQKLKETLSERRRSERREYSKTNGDERRRLLGRFGGGRSSHVVVVVMMVMVMVVMHLVGHRRSRGGGGFLRDGVAGEADGERGGGDKALDHGRTVLSKKTPGGLRSESCRASNEPRMNRGARAVTRARN